MRFKSFKASGNIQIMETLQKKVVLPKLVEMKENILKEMLLFMKMNMMFPELK
jgi:hypothetical protein